MLMPKKVKYRKQQRGRMAGKAWRGSDVSFGDYGLKAMEPCWMTARQIEAARVAMTRFIKRGGKIWIRVFPDKPITKKPAEVRMGKGKGAPEMWVAVVKRGRMLFELEGVNEELAREVNCPEADGIFISCTNFRALEGVEELEAELGKPVLTSNTTTMWHTLRRSGYDGPARLGGSLLRQHLAHSRRKHPGATEARRAREKVG